MTLARLRPYQLPVARAVIDSVINRRGLTFVCRMSRQAGKNETSAQVALAILGLANAGLTGDAPPSIVKTAPTLTPQVKTSMQRLDHAARAAGFQPRTVDGHITYIGDAYVDFRSGEPNANVVGATAGLLLEVDEAQDVALDVYDKRFSPMRAAFNATAIFWGTAWSEDDLLERERRAALAAQTRDGTRRVFDVPWRTVADSVAPYGAFVAAERARLGPDHPLFTTQYELHTLAGAGRLFTPDLIAQLHGAHARAPTPPLNARIVAGLDIAGGATDDARLHDRTVLTLGAVTPPSPADPIQQNHAAVLHHITWQGAPHDQLLPQLRDLLLNVWKVDTIAIDATGIGETIASVLAAALGAQRVHPVKFSRASKSALGFELLSTTATGRLKIYDSDGSPDALALWHEVTRCRRELLPGNLIDWRVPDDEGHDDYVTSLALFSRAANLHVARIARGHSPR